MEDTIIWPSCKKKKKKKLVSYPHALRSHGKAWEGAKETQLSSIPAGWNQDPDLAGKTWLNAAYREGYSKTWDGFSPKRP